MLSDIFTKSMDADVENLTASSLKIIKNQKIETIVYPDELRDDIYDFQKMCLYVWKSKVINTAFVSDNVQANQNIQSTINLNSVTNSLSNFKIENVDFSNPVETFQNSLDTLKSGVGKTLDTKDFDESEAECCFVLPLPLSLMEITSHSYSSQEGVISSTLGGLNEASDKIQKMLARKNSQKVMINPDKFQNYNGSEPRDFDFAFKLVSNNSDESLQISNLIYNLKKYSAPTKDEGYANLTLIQPRFFSIVFGNPLLNNIIRPIPMVLNQISITYDDGTYVSSTADGMPKSITLSLRFSETRTTHHNDY